MGDESSRKRRIISIPEELVLEILCYLPVKSLKRFTIVCKSWLRLIRDDRQFALKNYLARTTSSSKVVDNADYMFDVESSKNLCLYAFSEAKTFRHLKTFGCVADVPIRLSNSCHGIICFYLHTKAEVLLCNPAIQELVLLPPCPKMDNWIALGFDSINNDYKVVAYPKVPNPHTLHVDVYSLRRGHWRTVQVIDSECNFAIIGQAVSSAAGRICNWLTYKKIDKTNAIVSFDMVDEVLKELPMPNCHRPKMHDHQLLSSTRWDACLSCFPRSWDFNSRFIDVWVHKDEIWRKEISVNFPVYEPMRPFNYWFNDHELLVAKQKKAGTKRIVHYAPQLGRRRVIVLKKEDAEEVFHYDLDTQQLKDTQRKGRLWFSKGYVESLVSIKNLMPLGHGCKMLNYDQDIGSGQEIDYEYALWEFRRNNHARLFKSYEWTPPSM